MRGLPKSVRLLGRKDWNQLLHKPSSMISASGGGLWMCPMYSLYDEEDACGMEVAAEKRHSKTVAAEKRHSKTAATIL